MGAGITFRWLGVAGLAITAGGRTLAVDPFVTRPPFARFLFGRVTPNPRLVRAALPVCDYVLVSHAHWDHMMDVPEVAHQTGALACGSPNTCRLLALLGVLGTQIRPLAAGDRFALDGFRITVLPADHGFTAPTLGPGPLAGNLRPPLRLRDYRMDYCFSFLIEVAGYRLLILPGAQARARADVLFIVPTRRGPAYYAALLRQVQPAVVVPVHWDNLFRPLSTAGREFTRPGGMTLAWLRNFVHQTAPSTRVLIPEIARPYDLDSLVPQVLRSASQAPKTTF
jgi:L-ascorbate metabolism protein UlaG (beta-lactamase superfamily)